MRLTSQSGFTLFEILVSLALFTIVVTVTVGALLMLIGNNAQVNEQQNTLSVAAFALDNMTREIRTGYQYRCTNVTGAEALQLHVNNNSDNCTTGGQGLIITEGAQGRTSTDASNRISYYFENNSLYRKAGPGAGIRLIPPDIIVDSSRSRFYVTGAQTLSGASDVTQPTVTIVMVVSSTSTEPVTLQTTITQRQLDI